MDTTCATQDVMLVCRNGHVISDRLHTCPEQYLSHCDRCGTPTLDRCLTCGQELPGALSVPGPMPIGGRRPPQYCSQCGAAFPWTPRPRPAPTATAVGRLETLLRRLPLVARQLRVRQTDRPPFRVEDNRDLEDFLRAMLAIPFDEICLESRTPRYDVTTRTDFLLQSGALALTGKRVRPGFGERELTQQLEEDVAHYQRQPGCRTLVCFVFDPEQLLRDTARLEAVWSRPHDELDVRCVIG